MDSPMIEHKEYFLKHIQQLELQPDHVLLENDEVVRTKPETSVCVRIRPLAEDEKENKHIEGVIGRDHGIINIYEPKRKIRGRPELSKSSFALDEVYGPDKSSEDIYRSRVSELVEWGLQGGTSMLLAYGQTGSGKTYTSTAIESLLVDKLVDGQGFGKKEIHLSIFEVAGSNLFDLLNERRPLKVQEDAFGTMQLGGILEHSPKTSVDFLNLIERAKSLRATASTAKNDQSSRSHAICKINIIDTESKATDKGSITLVDLAGSEASSDISQHPKERFIEAREINKSLSILKECITKRAQWSISKAAGSQKHIHIPFRTNKLTQVLKSAFDVTSTQTCKTIVIACIAPSMADVAHSKNTLRYAETLRVPIPKAKPLAFSEQIPTTWSNKDVHNWIIKNSGKPTVNPHLLAPTENGTQVCRLSEEEFIRRALLTENVEPERARLLYYNLWSLYIDSRALLNRGTLVEKVEPTTARVKPNGAPKKTIKSGLFFRIKSGDTKENFDVVMAMGLERSGKWICAAVCLTDASSSGFELFIGKQVTLNTTILVEEIAFEYDSKTRLYYLKD